MYPELLSGEVMHKWIYLTTQPLWIHFQVAASGKPGSRIVSFSPTRIQVMLYSIIHRAAAAELTFVELSIQR
jgi:hypothetical protein